MTFREPDREIILDATPVAPTTLIQDEAVENPPLIEEEGPEAVPAGALAALPTKGEDPVRLYLKEIGKVSLLSARQEVEIGRRIEEGQMRLRRALVGIPMAVRALSEVGGNLRRRQTDPDDVIVLPEGGELDAEEIKSVLNAFGRVRRLTREIDRLQAALTDRRRTA